MSATPSRFDLAGPLPGTSQRIAGIFCLFGFFLHCLLSDPVLISMGYRYSGDTGSFYEKIHPGAYFIVLSLLVLLCGAGGPLQRIFILYRNFRIYVSFLLILLVLFAYMSLRSGLVGMAFWIDTHLVTVISAIVISCASVRDCRKALTLFFSLATLNCIIGIGEAITQKRIFTYDPSWVVLHEPEFRASALEGHPLNDGMFTSIALFCILGLYYKNWIKGILTVLMLFSLVAFGGRVALVFSTFGVFLLGARAVFKAVSTRQLSLRQLILIAMLAFCAPLLIGAGLYGLINSPLGERIAAHAQWDDSAGARQVALLVFNYLTTNDLIFGVSTDRIVDIAYRMNLSLPLSDIENPWLLMFMYLGYITFPIWLAMTAAFIWRLCRRQPFALKMVVISYFAIASTSNSFGRKDANYSIMVCAVICASRSLFLRAEQTRLAADETAHASSFPARRFEPG